MIYQGKKLPETYTLRNRYGKDIAEVAQFAVAMLCNVGFFCRLTKVWNAPKQIFAQGSLGSVSESIPHKFHIPIGHIIQKNT